MEKRQLFETFTTTDYIYNDGSSFNEDTSLESEIDGQYIIGMVEGQFFQPDGMSRNKRWYPRSLWENVLASADVKNRLMNRTMFGEIGHSDGPVTDMTLRNGEASHIITDLWIDEKGRGMGRAYILNTQKGRDLKIYLGAGAKLKVSTRGEGVYLDGELHDGCPIIDPDSYELQTVDFVLNPGFLETNAKLTAQKEQHQESMKLDFDTKEIGNVNENKTKFATKEGEQRMDMERYVRKLEDEIRDLKSENKSLTEELKSKEKELLETKFVESNEVKKLKEEYAPFKKLNASAKTINESLKRSHKLLEKAQSERDALKEELKAWTDSCGTIEQVNEARQIAEKALNKITEYQNLGSVRDIKELMINAKALREELLNIKSAAKKYEKLGSVKAIAELKENCERLLPKLSKMESMNKNYRKLGSVQEIREMLSNAEKLIPMIQKLKKYESIGKVSEIKELISNVQKMKESFKAYRKLGSVKDIKQLKSYVESALPELRAGKQLSECLGTPEMRETRKLRSYVKRAGAIIEKYLDTVGSIKEAKKIAESRRTTMKKVNVKEALTVSRKYGCTVESAAKMINKYGVAKASKLLESVKKARKSNAKLAESAKLIEEESNMDAANVKEETVTAQDFVSDGMITNAFNLDSLGTEVEVDDINELDGDKVVGEDAAIKLIQKYDKTFDVEDAPEVEDEKTAAEAEKEADKVIKDQE